MRSSSAVLRTRCTHRRIRSGRITPSSFAHRQTQLGNVVRDIFDEDTADEEEAEDGREENEVAEERILAVSVAVNLAELEASGCRFRVCWRCAARSTTRVMSQNSTSSRGITRSAIRDEKILIFSDTATRWNF